MAIVRPATGSVDCKGVRKNRDLRPISRFISEIRKDSQSYYKGEQETVPKLSNGTSFNDLEWPLTQISRSRYYSTPNNSEMVLDRAILTIADQQGHIWSIKRRHF